jgi:hypothetical protein
MTRQTSNGLLDRISRFFRDASATHVPSTAAHSGTEFESPARPVGLDDSSQDTSVETLGNALRRALSSQPGPLRGGVHFIHLQSLREQPTFDPVTSLPRVNDYAEKIIRSHLMSGDMFVQSRALEYVVVLADLDRTAAQVKCALIANEIMKHFLGSADIDRPYVTSLIDDTGDGVTLDQVSLATLIARAAAQPASSPQPDNAPDAIDSENPFGDPSEHTFSLDKVQFSYRALWDCGRRARSTYRCVAIRRDFVSGTRYDYAILKGLDSAEALTSELDSLYLEHAKTGLASLIRRNAKALIAWPVHINTVLANSNRRRYIEQLDLIPADIRGLVILELHGVEHGVPQSRLAEITSDLGRRVRAVTISVPPTFHNMKVLQGVNVRAIGFDASDIDTGDDRIFNLVTQFVERFRPLGMFIFVLGLKHSSTVLYSAAAGVHYVGGDRLGPLLDQPRPVETFTWDSLYRGGPAETRQ